MLSLATASVITRDRHLCPSSVSVNLVNYGYVPIVRSRAETTSTTLVPTHNALLLLVYSTVLPTWWLSAGHRHGVLEMQEEGCAFVVDRRWWNHHELMQLMWEAYAADPVSIGVP